MALKLTGGSAAVAAGSHADAAATRLARRTAELGRSLPHPYAGSWMRVDRFLVSASSLVTVFLLARYLDLATFGAFMLAYTALLLFMGLQKALVAQPHRELGAALSEPERRWHTGAAVVLQGLAGLALCAVLCVAGGLTAALYSPPAGDVLIALAVTAVPWLAQDFLRRALHARGRSRDAAINSVVTQGLQIFGTVVLCSMAAAWATPASALSVLALSAMVGAIVGMWQLQPLVDFGRAGEGQYRQAWTEFWYRGRAATAQSGLGWIGAQGPSWIVALLLGVEPYGIYRAVTHLATAAHAFLQAGLSGVPEEIARNPQPGGTAVSAWVRRAMTVVLLSLAPFIAILVLLPAPVLEMAYGDKLTATGLASVLALTAVAQALGYARIPLNLGLGALRPGEESFVWLLPAVLALTLGVALVQLLGLLGAPIAVLAVNAALLLAAWVAYRRALNGR